MNPAAEVLLKKRAAAARARRPREAGGRRRQGGRRGQGEPAVLRVAPRAGRRGGWSSRSARRSSRSRRSAPSNSPRPAEAAALAQRNVELENRAALAEAEGGARGEPRRTPEALAQTHGRARTTRSPRARAHSDGRLAGALRQGEEAGKRVDELAGCTPTRRRAATSRRAARSAPGQHAAQMRHVREAVALARAHDERADRLEREAVRLRQRAAKTDEVIACLEQCLQRTLSLFDMHRLAALGARRESERASGRRAGSTTPRSTRHTPRARARGGEAAASARAARRGSRSSDRSALHRAAQAHRGRVANASALAQRTFASMVPALEPASDTHRTYGGTIRNRLALAARRSAAGGGARRHEAGGPAARPGDDALGRARGFKAERLHGNRALALPWRPDPARLRRAHARARSRARARARAPLRSGSLALRRPFDHIMHGSSSALPS